MKATSSYLGRECVRDCGQDGDDGRQILREDLDGGGGRRCEGDAG